VTVDFGALLRAVADGTLAPEAALERLRHFPEEDIGIARIDHHRAIRLGHPEVVLSSHKTVGQVVAIAGRLAAAHGSFLCTRVSEEQGRALVTAHPRAVWNALARTVYLASEGERPDPIGTVAVVCAGTSDLPVADEAAVVAEAFGLGVRRIVDVGVAGLHRLLRVEADLVQADVLIVVAGMEGALPSVIGGLVRSPVIAVPTSVGYGASFGGVAALLAMLNSCAEGITVVNIDNGFGAAVAAYRILAGRLPAA
jgi:NCAIR mutase (PurE)-related protein